MTDAVRLVALNVGFAAAGAALVVSAGFPLVPRWLPTVLGLAPATGLAVCGLVAAASAMVGIGVSVTATALLTGATVALAGFLLARRRPVRGSLEPATRRNPVERILEAGLLAVLVYLSIGVVRLAAATNLDLWDGWAMWAPKTHALFVEGDVWGPIFRSPEYLLLHQEYPILLPSLEALSAKAVGRFDPLLADIEAAFLLAAFGWAAWALLRVVVLPALAAAAAVALLAGTPLIANTVVNYADAAVAVFTALGILALLMWLTTGASAMLVPGAAFLGAAASTKAEGVLFVLAAIVAAAVLVHRLGRPLRELAVFAACVLVVPALWAFVDRLNGPGAKNVHTEALLDPGYLVEAADRIPISGQRLVTEIVEGWPLACLGAGLALGAACVARRWHSALFVALWVVLSLVGLVGTYTLSTSPLDWHLTTSADRVVFSIALTAATVSPLLIGLAWEQSVTALQGLVSDARPRSD
jgi:hypothetical protein